MQEIGWSDSLVRPPKGVGGEIRKEDEQLILLFSPNIVSQFGIRIVLNLIWES